MEETARATASHKVLKATRCLFHEIFNMRGMFTVIFQRTCAYRTLACFNARPGRKIVQCIVYSISLVNLGDTDADVALPGQFKQSCTPASQFLLCRHLTKQMAAKAFGSGCRQARPAWGGIGTSTLSAA